MEQQYNEKLQKLGYCQLVCDIFSDWESVKDEILLPDRKDGSGNGTIHVFLGAADCDLRKEFPNYYQSVENNENPEIGAVQVKHYFLVSNIISMLGYVCKYYFEKKENVNNHVRELLSSLLSFENQDGLVSTTSLFKLSTGSSKLRPYFKQFESNGVFTKIIRKILLPKSSYKISLFKNKENNYAAFWLIGFPQMNEFEVDSNNLYLKKKDNEELESPSQIIYYGVPGCGKSYEVNKNINDKLDELGITDKEYHKVRCVFHPEYSNADFVGQVYPFIDPDGNGVDYRFKPGPFAEIVRRAYRNPTEPFFLVIEEINRGNAAAIFGEAFQLLDRIKQGDTPDSSTENIYQPGWSAYGILNSDLNAYIRQKSVDEEEIRKLRQTKEPLFEKEIKPQRDDCSHKIIQEGVETVKEHELNFSWTTAIRLPPNLSIYATMNTSDQNVFTMDNAFQRRFKFRMIENKLDNEAQYNILIGKNKKDETTTEVRWGDFRKWINRKILNQSSSFSKSEDKCLGGWFISTDAIDKTADGKVTKYDNISREDFAEKVLKYLWDDVFKRNAATEVFNKNALVNDNDDVLSFSKIAKAFKDKDNKGFDAFIKVFVIKDDDRKELSPNRQDKPAEGVNAEGDAPETPDNP